MCKAVHNRNCIKRKWGFELTELENIFRTSIIGGYDKSDVSPYIKSLTLVADKYQELAKKLQAENAELTIKVQNSETKLREQKAEIKRLQALAEIKSVQFARISGETEKFRSENKALLRKLSKRTRSRVTLKKHESIRED